MRLSKAAPFQTNLSSALPSPMVNVGTSENSSHKVLYLITASLSAPIPRKSRASTTDYPKKHLIMVSSTYGWLITKKKLSSTINSMFWVYIPSPWNSETKYSTYSEIKMVILSIQMQMFLTTILLVDRPLNCAKITGRVLASECRDPRQRKTTNLFASV